MIRATKGRNTTALGTTLLLPLLLVMLALTAATPSLATTILSKTRVRGFELENLHHDRPGGDLTHRIRPENRTASLEIASVSPLAARVLSIPKVVDPKLSNIVNDLYKGAKGLNPIGTGSTADAVRNELATGLPTFGTFHSQKAEQYINALSNWLKRNPNASYYDRLVAESLRNDLKSALGGY